MNFIAIDFETANASRSSICSVGFAMVENGRLIKTEHILIKPVPNYYDGFNSHLHGIDDSHTKDKRTFKQQWQELRPYFHNQTIIAHNAAFDCSVLRYTLDEARLTYPDLKYHCTYRLAEKALGLYSHKLNVVSAHFNIKLKHHNAESDAQAAALIALKLCEKFKADSLETLSKSLGFKIGRIEGKTNSYIPFSKK
jgi:DNA polymerase-3 subunit epsilon